MSLDRCLGDHQRVGRGSVRATDGDDPQRLQFGGMDGRLSGETLIQ